MNRLLYVADNLRVMRGIDSGSVDLIATDPPFNSKRSFNAPLGSKAAKQKFDDRWRWDEVTDEWHDLLAADHPAVKELVEAAAVIEGGTVSDTGVETGADNSIAAFIAWMAPRVVEMHRILKPTGSLYLHCDPSANSYLRLLLDAVFGRANFRNEIVWRRTGAHGRSRRWGPIHDTILFYSKSIEYAWNRTFQAYDDQYIEDHYTLQDERGRYQSVSLSGPGTRTGSSGEPWRNVDPGRGGRHWELPPDRSLPNWFERPNGYADMTVQERLDILDDQSMIHWPAKSDGVPRYRRYSDVSEGNPLQDMIVDIRPVGSGETTGWQTQKPLALYQRIIKASSNEGDLVLDPFCGCATTCVAAEQLNRRWIGIDIDPVAETVTRERLKRETGIFQFGENPVTVKKNPSKRSDIPSVSDAKMRVVLWNNQGRKCANPYCGSENLRAEDLDLDHRIPKSRGGSDDQSNRIGLCRNCNTRKGAKAWGTFLDESRARLPHPKVGRVS